MPKILAANWPRFETLLSADPDDTPLFIAAIEAAASIRPQAAVERLTELTNSEDEDITDTVELVSVLQRKIF